MFIRSTENNYCERGSAEKVSINQCVANLDPHHFWNAGPAQSEKPDPDPYQSNKRYPDPDPSRSKFRNCGRSNGGLETQNRAVEDL
jgi:hypothetical protein